MKKNKRRISVTVDIDVPEGMTLGKTAAWVEGCFPKSAHAECGDQRLAKPREPKKPTVCPECGGTGQTYSFSHGRVLGSSIKPCSRGCVVPSRQEAAE